MRSAILEEKLSGVASILFRLSSLLTVLLLFLSGCYREPNIHSPTRRARVESDRIPVMNDAGPPEWVIRYREGVRLLSEGYYHDSVLELNETLRLVPKSGLVRINRGVALRGLGEYEKSLADFRAVVEMGDPIGGYMLWQYVAEILATCPDARLRNGTEAVEFATKACEKSGWNHGVALAVLAAAYAETGDFERAIHWQTEADAAWPKESLPNKVREKLPAEMAQRMESYRNRKPYRKLFPDPYSFNR